MAGLCSHFSAYWVILALAYQNEIYISLKEKLVKNILLSCLSLMFHPLIMQFRRAGDSSSFWNCVALHLSWTCCMVISCVHEKDLESVAEVVLVALPCVHILLIEGLFACGNRTWSSLHVDPYDDHLRALEKRASDKWTKMVFDKTTF